MTGSAAPAAVQPTAAPPRRSRARPAAAAVCIAAAGALLGVALFAERSSAPARLEVYEHAAGEVVYARPAAVGETFALEHVHSVTKRPVVETFSVLDPDTIALEELQFDTFGANLPAGPEETDGRTTTFLHEDGAYRVLHHSRPVGVISLRVGGPEVNHTVVFDDGERLALLDVAPRGAHVELRVTRR